MPPRFSSPEGFLAYIRSVHSSPMAAIQSDTPNLEFLKIHEEKLRAAGQIDREALASPHDYLVRELWQDLRQVLPAEFLSTIGTKFAVGSLDNISMNALCVRSSEGFVVLLINAGLMTLLNKVSKLLIAQIVPNSVEYCNRSPGSEVTPAVARRWYLEVCEHYRKTGKPLGPQIHLSASAEARHSGQLHGWEILVFCHELGHIVAGHLNRHDAWSINASLGMIEAFKENESHEMETEADILGYIMARKYWAKHGSGDESAVSQEFDDRFVFANMIGLFDLLFLLGAKESASHPDPLDRICNIAAFVYGEAFAEIVASSYGDVALIADLLRKPLLAPTGLLERVAQYVSGRRD
jgi:energy-converting hydrogenase Eha subunit C